MNRVVSKVEPLLSTKWLADKILRKSAKPHNVRVLDGSSMDGAREVFNKYHIPGAQFFDIEICRDRNSPIPRMLPNPRDFEDYVGQLGICNKSHVVVYDLSPGGLFSSARVWWMLRYFGHDSVSILNGGLTRWIADGYETTDAKPNRERKTFKAQPNEDLLVEFEDVVKLAKEGCKSMPLVDARSPENFMSHIPGATNVHYSLLSDAEKREVYSPEKLRQIFKSGGIDINKHFVASCNSGVTACVLAFCAYLCGNKDVPVYDGSWQEWIRRANSDT